MSIIDDPDDVGMTEGLSLLDPALLFEKLAATRHRCSSVPQSKEDTRPVLLVKLARNFKDLSSPSPPSDATHGVCVPDLMFKKSCQLSDWQSNSWFDKPQEIQPAIWSKEGPLISRGKVP